MKKRKFFKSDRVRRTVKKSAVAKKDLEQDRKIKQLEKKLKANEPPVKSSYLENIDSPENVWFAFGLPYPAKGGADNERLGQEIIVKSVNFRWLINASETDDFDTLRFVIVQFMDGNAVSEFPLNYNTNLWLEPTTDYPYLSPFNTQSASTYRVLFDKTYNVCANGVAQMSENVLITSKDMAISKLKFDGDTGGGLPGLDRGLIICFACSDSTAVPNPDVKFTCKMNFIDT